MAHGRLGAVRDDELLGGAALVGERALHLELDPLARERLAAEREHAVRALRAPQQLDPDGDTGLDGAAGTTDPGKLVLVLDPAAFVEEALVRGQLDPVRTQVIGGTERKAARRDRAFEPEVAAGSQVQLVLVRVGVEPSLQQLVQADLLQRQNLEVCAEVADPPGLERR